MCSPPLWGEVLWYVVPSPEFSTPISQRTLPYGEQIRYGEKKNATAIAKRYG